MVVVTGGGVQKAIRGQCSQDQLSGVVIRKKRSRFSQARSQGQPKKQKGRLTAVEAGLNGRLVFIGKRHGNGDPLIIVTFCGSHERAGERAGGGLTD